MAVRLSTTTNLKVPAFEGEQFWFAKFIAKNLVTFGPFTKRKHDKANTNIELTNVIGPKLYSHRNKNLRDFVDDMSEEMEFGKDTDEGKKLTHIFKDVYNRETILKYLNEGKNDPGRMSFAGCLSLVDNGVTFDRLLGKEFDNDLNREAMKDMALKWYQTFGGANYQALNARTNEAKWAILSNREPRLTPAEAIRFLQVERITSDPVLVNLLMTQKEIKDAGLIFNDNNPPEPIMFTDSGMPLYDMSVAYPMGTKIAKNGVIKYIPNIPSYAKGCSINDFTNMQVVENLETFVEELQIATKTKVIIDTTLEKNEAVVTKNNLRSRGRRLQDYISRALGGTGHSVSDSLTLNISNKNNEAERAYLVTKNLCKMSIENYLDETEKLVLSGATNLPDITNFRKERDNLSNITACLIASHVVKMGNLKLNDQAVLSNIFKVEACQGLEQVADKTNTWTMPLISSLFGMSLSKFASDLNINLENYAVNEDVETANMDSLVKILYAPKIYDPTEGLLSQQTDEIVIDKTIFNRIKTDTLDTRYKTRTMENTQIPTPVVEPVEEAEPIAQPAMQSVIVTNTPKKTANKPTEQSINPAEKPNLNIPETPIVPKNPATTSKPKTIPVEKSGFTVTNNAKGQVDLFGQPVKDEDLLTAKKSKKKPTEPVSKIVFEKQSKANEVPYREDEAEICEQVEDAINHGEPILKDAKANIRKKSLKPGYIQSDTGMTFSIAQYTRDVMEISSFISKTKINQPVFQAGNEIYENFAGIYPVVVENKNLVATYNLIDENENFVDEIRKRANTAINRILTSEFNRAEKATNKARNSIRLNEKRIISTGIKQDIAGNVAQGFSKTVETGNADAVMKLYQSATQVNPSSVGNRFLAQIKATACLSTTSDELTQNVLKFYMNNKQLLNGASAGMVYQVYMKCVGKGAVHSQIRNEVVKPLLGAVYQDSISNAFDIGNDSPTTPKVK